MVHGRASQPDTPPVDIMRALDAVAATGRRRTVHVRGRAVALVPQANRARSGRKVFTKNDPLWDIVGIIRDDGPADVSDNVDAYLAEAYLDTHE